MLTLENIAWKPKRLVSLVGYTGRQKAALWGCT
jgi:hypothetical protein